MAAVGNFNVIPTPNRSGRTYTYQAVKSLSIRSQVTSTVWIVKFLYRKCCRKGTRLEMKVLMTVSLADTGSRISFPATGVDVLLQRYNLVCRAAVFGPLLPQDVSRSQPKESG
jgi:hypothetical protein